MLADWLRIVLSTTGVYFFIIFSLKIFGKKQLAQLTITDLVFILLISNSVQNAMVGPDNSLTGGIVAATTLFIWNFILKAIFYRFKKLDSFVQGEPVLLIYKGYVKNENIIKSKITFEELEEAMREHGIDQVEKVSLAMLERDGSISIVANSFSSSNRKKRKMHRAIKVSGG